MEKLSELIKAIIIFLTISDDPINKLEKAAIKRFTVGYEKLCKNCPTRLQPRVDTLTEMIMGLSTEDRDNLLSAVAQRIEEDAFKTQEEAVGLRTPEEVYDFQVAGAVNAPVETKVVKIENFQIPRMDGDAEQSREVSQEDKEQESVKKQQKLIAKMDQTKAKLRKSDAKLAEIDCLLQATKSLLSKDKRMRDIAFDTGFFDEEEIEKLSSMNRSELKLQLLRYRAQQAKFERSKAKTRAKRYAASLQLTTKRITPV
eukprot:CAMPEP_0194210138 /NCGR_PEP_ID=MMETSP0156-20130528/8036_1 /TAXON_ID=33649 /ORGANISM="Thalassionema nitzschioides, Strain L26-B" /LENGTH=256 /DNA_ID=CAMNT_0038937451 /DNA_START=149 /DNA_END=920 /DNA_ORIENTATION=-